MCIEQGQRTRRARTKDEESEEKDEGCEDLGQGE